MANEIKKYLDYAALDTLVDQIKAEDAKVLAAAQKYTDDAGKLYDGAGSAATAEENAKKYADEQVQALADGAVKTNADAIAVLNGEGDGSVKKAIADAKTLIDADIDSVEEKADKNAEDIAAINAEGTGILAVAKSYTDTEVAKVQGEVDALETYVGTLPETATATDIVGYIQEKTAGIATDTALEELTGRVKNTEDAIGVLNGEGEGSVKKAVSDASEALQSVIDGVEEKADKAQEDVDALAQTHATDKGALEAAIALKADQTALDEVAGVAGAAATKAALEAEVKTRGEEITRVEGLVTEEAAKAREEEGKLDARLVEVEAFFKLAEGEALDTALDTLVEIQTYLDGEGAVADQMLLDIAANKKSIEDHMATDHDFAAADTALKEELNAAIALKADKTAVEGIDGRVEVVEGKVSTLEGEMDAAEGRLDAVEAAVATKAEAQALTDAVAALDEVDADFEARIAAIEGQLGEGEGTVADMIADAAATAKQEAIDAAAQDATDKADAAEQNAKDYADGLNTTMSERVDALEAIDHEHANKALLDTYTQTEANLADAVAKKHEHAHFDVLEGITSEKVAAWDAAEGNAKTYADGLNTAMTTKVDGIGTRVGTLETTIATKADAEDLEDAIDRIAANELAIAANTTAINSFVAITSAEVNALFA